MTDQPERFPGIQGRCPACRGASLFAGSGGHVTCRRIDCPNPSAADELLHASSLDAPLRDQLQAAIKALGTSETLLARARAACDQLERAVTNADGRLLTPYDRGVDTAIRRVRKVFDQPTPAPAPAPASWLAAGTRDHAIPTQHAFTARPVDPETERAATERAIQAAADSEKSAAWFAAHSQASPAATEATEHHYLSTGCLHGDHGYCQGMTGLNGSKRPGECKFCRAPCRCSCHQTRH